jgi:hypothetical protein
MKHFNLVFILLFVSTLAFGQSDLIITGVIDGPLPGGTPKGVEFYALSDISDLSIYGVGAANNGGGTDGEEFTFPSQAVAGGTFLYLTTDNAQFNAFFGFDADFVSEGSSSAAGINGDDAVELFQNGAVVDVFGDINTDGTGQPWEYLDGWAYRVDGTGPDGMAFQLGSWTFSGPDALDDETTNSTASIPFPIGTYATTGTEFVNANDDAVMIEPNQMIDIDVLANDLVPNELTSLVIIENGDVGGGTIVDNKIRYFPQQDECGMDTLRYEVCNLISCDTARVFIDIECPIDYPSFTIGEVTTEDADGVAESLELKVKLQGIAYGVNLRPGGLQFALIDAAGDGITVFSFSEDFGYAMQEGDELIIQGEITQFNGLTEIIPETLEVVSQGNSLLSPTVVTGLGEDTESRLVRLENVTLVDPMQWNNMGAGFDVEVTDGTNTYVVRIDNNVDLYTEDPPLGTFNVTGIGTQFDDDEEAPFDRGYSLLPRYIPDIDPFTGVVDPALGALLSIFPNPVVNDILTITLSEQMDEVILTNGNGQIMKRYRSVQDNLEINLNALPAGAYNVTIRKEGRIWTEQILKQ